MINETKTPNVFERVAYAFTSKLDNEEFKKQLDTVLQEAREQLLEGPNKISEENLVEVHKQLSAKWLILQDQLVQDSAELQAIEWLLYGQDYERFDGELTEVRVKTEKLQ